MQIHACFAHTLIVELLHVGRTQLVLCNNGVGRTARLVVCCVHCEALCAHF